MLYDDERQIIAAAIDCAPPREATEAQVVAAGDMVRDGRAYWTDQDEDGLVWLVITDAGKRAIRIDALVRQFGAAP